MKQIFGLHLLIDGFVRNGITLYPDYIYDLFDDLVKELKMQYLQRPIVMRVPLDKEKLKTDEDEGGYSGICQITTSHISIHGWPLRKAFMMDIFSCKDFDYKAAREIVVDSLQVENANFQLIERTGP